MSQEIEQRDETRNQSTADFTQKRVFIFDNRFIKGDIINVSEDTPLVLKPYSLVLRSTTTAGGFLTAIAGATLANVVGITANAEEMTIAEETSAPINVGTKGTIDGNYLNLPDTVTLDTVVGSKTVRDILEALGFHIDVSGVEHTKHDN